MEFPDAHTFRKDPTISIHEPKWLDPKKILLSKHIEKNKFKLSIETCNFIQLVMSEVHRRLRFDETHGNIPKGRDGKIARLLGMLLGHMKERQASIKPQTRLKKEPSILLFLPSRTEQHTQLT